MVLPPAGWEKLTAELATAAERAALLLPRPAAVLLGRHAASTARHVYVNEVQ